MSIPSNGWIPTRNEASPAFKPAAPNAYGEDSQKDFEAKEETSFSEFLFGEDGADFYDVLDVVNPLQHIPIVGDLYRELTGDEIGHGARMLGGTLFGGGIGLVGSVANAAVDATTGRDISEHAEALWDGDEAEEPEKKSLLASLFSDDAAAEQADPAQTAALPAQAPVAQQSVPGVTSTAAVAPLGREATPTVETAPRLQPVADGMGHFSAFNPSGQLISPAELAAQLNQQRVAQRQAAVESVTATDAPDPIPEASAAPQPQPIAQAPSPQPAPETAAGSPPRLEGGWFDNAMMSALQKYQALKQQQTQDQLL